MVTSFKYKPGVIMPLQDAETIDNLNIISGFKTVSQKVIGGFSEHYAEIEYSDEAIKEAVCRLSVNKMPKKSIDWAYHIYTFSVGESNCRIILLNGDVNLLTDDENPHWS